MMGSATEELALGISSKSYEDIEEEDIQNYVSETKDTLSSLPFV
jgi:hypothetical protein